MVELESRCSECRCLAAAEESEWPGPELPGSWRLVDANGVTVGFIGPDDLPREDIVFDYERDCYVYLSDAMERLSPTRAWEIFAGGRSVAEFIQESGENTPEDAVWAYVGVKGNQVNPLFETAAHARAVGEKLIAHMKMTLESQAGR